MLDAFAIPLEVKKMLMVCIFLVAAPIAEGVDRAVVEIDGLDPHQLLGHAVRVDLADRRGDDIAHHHRGLGLGRHHDHAVGGGLGGVVALATG